MSSRFHGIARAAAMAAMLALGSQAFAQSDDVDPEMRIQQLENQLRQLTGQNEELQYRNRQLEERLRLLQGGAQAAPGGQPAAQPNIAAVPPIQPNPAYRPPQQPSRAMTSRRSPLPRRSSRSRSRAPGAPRAAAVAMPSIPARTRMPRARRSALGGGQLPIPQDADRRSRRTRRGRTARSGEQRRCAQSAGAALPPPPARSPGASAALTTCRRRRRRGTSSTSASAICSARTMRWPKRPCATSCKNTRAIPWSPDSQYWLGESFFQRQQYRDAAEAFLGVTTKFDKSAKAPDALLRLGQSLAALKEKEAACAALGEVTRKYPRASSGVKAGRGPRAKAG